MASKLGTAMQKVRVYGLGWSLRWGLLVGYYLSRRRLPGRLGFDETNVFDRRWDLLVILDACTVDLLDRVWSDYDFLADTSTVWSAGASSWEWMEKTFAPDRADQLRETAYVTANPHSSMFLEAEDLQVLDEVWQYGWDEDLGTVPARAVTDRTIATMRAERPDRTVAHYMQPHFPAVNYPDLGSAMKPEEAGGAWDGSVWDLLRTGELSRERVEEAYEDNLRYVLDDVALLLENVDAERVVISADHGNAFGEFGMYGHHGYTPLASLREVPWTATTATDLGTHTPDSYAREGDHEVDDRLEALGYVT